MVLLRPARVWESFDKAKMAGKTAHKHLLGPWVCVRCPAALAESLESNSEARLAAVMRRQEYAPGGSCEGGWRPTCGRIPPTPPPPVPFFPHAGGGVAGQGWQGNGKKNETSGMHGMSDSIICGRDGPRPRVPRGLHRGKRLREWHAAHIPSTCVV